jgi:hypothetical protein
MENISNLTQNMGWATGYALSIYGTEYYAQCPFQTGNGYGDGRAISIFEAVINGKRWEFQLKGAGKTPYCRGADGRAVLRSSVREFLAQEHMHALSIPTSRSLTLFTSKKEQVTRPWFRDNSYSKDPEVMIEEDVAITTRVASSFIRVGQLELFGRRARKNEHENALKELEMIVLHLIDREYSEVINQDLDLKKKIIILANEFQNRLSSLVANWIRVGYCQGNFNSDNCAAGGFTLDYGPFGFIEMFDPKYQSWTGGGMHFSFFNQPLAAQKNFKSFCSALKPLLSSNPKALEELEIIENNFDKTIGISVCGSFSRSREWEFAHFQFITFLFGLLFCKTYRSYFWVTVGTSRDVSVVNFFSMYAFNFLNTCNSFCRSDMSKSLSWKDISNGIISRYRSFVPFVDQNSTFIGLNSYFFQTNSFYVGSDTYRRK